ncbi:HNH endonuclease [Rhodopseudomonas sp.]|uniref:HNH endonuclease n=1 Tax=Rhodopseudomonas sp. TaxID=1078 RepID=UPI003B3AA12D
MEVSFVPGAYAGELLGTMRTASREARGICESVLAACIAGGAEVRFNIADVQYSPPDAAIWEADWTNFTATLSRGQLPVNSGDAELEARLLLQWTSRLAAAIFALLPLEADEQQIADVAGFPEGAKTLVAVNRYERDRRNRAAALAIHGYRCKACNRLMSEQYGDVAATLIEVHHVTPVHAIGSDYLINPAVDLIPLCPNCHAVAHTRNPPLAIHEIQESMTGRPNQTRADGEAVSS